jgi:hypothetical protein
MYGNISNYMDNIFTWEYETIQSLFLKTLSKSYTVLDILSGTFPGNIISPLLFKRDVNYYYVNDFEKNKKIIDIKELFKSCKYTFIEFLNNFISKSYIYISKYYQMKQYFLIKK